MGEPIKIVTYTKKGGVGKTTSTINIAAGLARYNKSVLVIDLDSQGHIGLCIDLQPSPDDITTDKILIEKADINAAIKTKTILSKKETYSYDIINSTINMETVDGNCQGKIRLFESALKKLDKQYDYILFDCPAQLSVAVTNALYIADYIMVPVELQSLAMDGLGQLMGILDEVQEDINPGIQLLGVLPTKADYRTNQTKMYKNKLKEIFGDIILPVIDFKTDLSKAQEQRKDIFEYKESCLSAGQYRNVAYEIIKRTARE